MVVLNVDGVPFARNALLLLSRFAILRLSSGLTNLPHAPHRTIECIAVPIIHFKASRAKHRRFHGKRSSHCICDTTGSEMVLIVGPLRVWDGGRVGYSARTVSQGDRPPVNLGHINSNLDRGLNSQSNATRQADRRWPPTPRMIHEALQATRLPRGWRLRPRPPHLESRTRA